MTKIKHYIFLFFMIIVSGSICVSCYTYSGTIPTQTHKPTQSSPTVTATLPSKSTPTATHPFNIDFSCWPIAQLQANNDIPGSFIISNYHDDIDSFYYWDVSSFHVKPITWDRGGVAQTWTPSDRPKFSPDGNFMLSTFFSKGNNSRRLTLMSPSKTLSTNLQQGDYPFIYLANGKILIVSGTNRGIKSKNYKEGDGFTDVYYIFDPISNKLSSHSIFLPKFAPVPKPCYGLGCSARFETPFLINYSPDGRYVLYHSTEDGIDGFSLLDISLNEVKWTMPEPYYTKMEYFGDSNIPAWKFDSSSLTYIWNSDGNAGTPNFYSISIDGKTSQIIDMKSVLGNIYDFASPLLWSPDMRYAIITANNSDKHYNMFIWDAVEKVLFNPCLPTNNRPYSPTWSFDSKHIQAELFFEGTPTPTGIITDGIRRMILDIPNKTILELPNNEDMYNFLNWSGDTGYAFQGWVNWEVP